MHAADHLPSSLAAVGTHFAQLGCKTQGTRSRGGAVDRMQQWMISVGRAMSVAAIAGVAVHLEFRSDVAASHVAVGSRLHAPIWAALQRHLASDQLVACQLAQATRDNV